jgi:hypothetical protein
MVCHLFFYKKFWSLIGDKVKYEVLNVLNGGPMPQGWNDTIIVLIPKNNNPQNLKDLRPINLCNVLYKLISKVLANRLKQDSASYYFPYSKCLCPRQTYYG